MRVFLALIGRSDIFEIRKLLSAYKTFLMTLVRVKRWKKSNQTKWSFYKLDQETKIRVICH